MILGVGFCYCFLFFTFSMSELILISLKHIILVEGFDLNQLDSEIQEVENENF